MLTSGHSEIQPSVDSDMLVPSPEIHMDIEENIALPRTKRTFHPIYFISKQFL